MSNDLLTLQLLAERAVVRKDQISEIDFAVDLITAKSVETKTTTGYALNLCIVLDRSGSMEGDKLELAKRSCIEIFDSLNPADKLTVLAFDTEVLAVVNPQTPRQGVRDRLAAINAGGSTNLAKGWYFGLLELQTYASPQHINRLILLSDGQANQGEQKATVLGAESGRARDELAITTSTIGIGKGFQEDILTALAHQSGGRFWFIGEASIEDIIREEFSGALSVLLERPSIEVDLPLGIEIVRELNDLPKISNRYRLRPIKANDRFAFALRLRVDPARAQEDKLTIGATLLDGAGVVERAESTLHAGTVEEFVQSAADPRVAAIVTKYLHVASDEKIVERMDAGDVTAMLDMLQQHSDLVKELEAKLAGEAPISWEAMTEKERAEVEVRLQHRDAEIYRCQMEIQEDRTLIAVGELIDLMQGLGKKDEALQLLTHSRKHHQQRMHRDIAWGARGRMDDWAVRELLSDALKTAQLLIGDNPGLRQELTEISERINEQLAHFS